MLPLFLYSNWMVRSFFYDAVPSVIEDWTKGFHLCGGALPSSCKGLCGGVCVRGAVCAPIKELPGFRKCCRIQRAWVEGSLEPRAGSSHAWNGCGQISFLPGAQLCLSSIELWFVCRNRPLPAAHWTACWATHLLRLFSAHESFNENGIYIEKEAVWNMEHNRKESKREEKYGPAIQKSRE